MEKNNQVPSYSSMYRDNAGEYGFIDEMLNNSALRSMTGKFCFFKDMENAISAKRRGVAAVFAIRHFSYLFTVYGNNTGVRLSKTIEGYLSGFVASGEFFASISNNNFAVFLNCDTETAKERLSAVFNTITHDLALDKCHMKVNFVCGLYPVTENDTKVSELLEKASAAMLHAVDIPGGNTEISVYSTEIYQTILRCSQLENDLYKSIRNNELIVEIQPKFDLKTGKCVSAEALVRWMHPTLGKISPDEFLGFAEQTGFIIDIDMFVLETVCRYMRKWLDSGYTPVQVAVNQSRLHIADPNYVDDVFNMMTKYDIWPNLIVLETTETIAFNDYISVTEVLHRLHEYGFSLSMDDFGSGYTSLHMLNELEYDELKLDQKIIACCNNSERNEVLLRHVIAMAHDMNMTVVAEGIETKEQAEILKRLNCDVGQGFYFAYPMSIESFEASIFGQVTPDSE